ncbi:MAG: hypothetical protein Q9207_005060 [Kuettlingeria erythrocarpa]
MLGHPVCLSTCLVQFLLATLLFRHSIAAITQPPDNLIQHPITRNASDASAIAINSTNLLKTRPGELTCTGQFSPLSPQSCLDAIEQIPDTEDPLRSANFRFIQLPQRFSSSDGRCVVYVGRGSWPRNFEIITGKRLRHLINHVFRQCLIGQGRMGVIWERGREGSFYVRFEQFNPSEIRCADRRPDPAPSDCRAALDAMPFDASTTPFSESRPQHPRGVQLPELFVGEPRVESTCMIILDTTGDDQGRWALIWNTAVAIDAMCVRRGLMGWGSSLGLSFSTHSQISALDPPVKVHRAKVFAYHCAIQGMRDVYRLLSTAPVRAPWQFLDGAWCIDLNGTGRMHRATHGSTAVRRE